MADQAFSAEVAGRTVGLARDASTVLFDVTRLSAAVDRRRRELVLQREWQGVFDRLGLNNVQRERAAQRAVAHATSMCR